MKIEDRTKLCYKTADQIINVLDGLGYITERKPNYPEELRDLITIEIRRAIEVFSPTIDGPLEGL